MIYALAGVVAVLTVWCAWLTSRVQQHERLPIPGDAHLPQRGRLVRIRDDVCHMREGGDNGPHGATVRKQFRSELRPCDIVQCDIRPYELGEADSVEHEAAERAEHEPLPQEFTPAQEAERQENLGLARYCLARAAEREAERAAAKRQRLSVELAQQVAEHEAAEQVVAADVEAAYSNLGLAWGRLEAVLDVHARRGLMPIDLPLNVLHSIVSMVRAHRDTGRDCWSCEAEYERACGDSGDPPPAPAGDFSRERPTTDVTRCTCPFCGKRFTGVGILRGDDACIHYVCCVDDPFWVVEAQVENATGGRFRCPRYAVAQGALTAVETKDTFGRRVDFFLRPEAGDGD